MGGEARSSSRGSVARGPGGARAPGGGGGGGEPGSTRRWRCHCYLPPPPPFPEKAPSVCIFSCEWGKDRRDVSEGNLYRKSESFLNMAAAGMVHGMRSLSSAALDLAQHRDGCFRYLVGGWDVAVGIYPPRGGQIRDERCAARGEVRLGGRRLPLDYSRPGGYMDGRSGAEPSGRIYFSSASF
jgi:myo-inositol-1(or 4)-monophosphatase